MRRLMLCSMLAVTACSAAPTGPMPPPPAPKLTGKETTGEKALMAQQYCTAQANSQCGASSLYCTAFRQKFIKDCMIRVGVPPDYVIALTMP